MHICCAGAAAQLNMSDCEIFKNETPACYRDGFDADRVKYKPCGSHLCHNALYASTRFRRCLSFCPGRSPLQWPTHTSPGSVCDLVGFIERHLVRATSAGSSQHLYPWFSNIPLLYFCDPTACLHSTCIIFVCWFECLSVTTNKGIEWNSFGKSPSKSIINSQSLFTGFFNDSCKIITGECDDFVLPTEASAIPVTANGTETTAFDSQTDNHQDYTTAKTRSASINPPSDEPNTVPNEVTIYFGVVMIYFFGAIYNMCENEWGTFQPYCSGFMKMLRFYY